MSPVPPVRPISISSSTFESGGGIRKGMCDIDRSCRPSPFRLTRKRDACRRLAHIDLKVRHGHAELQVPASLKTPRRVNLVDGMAFANSEPAPPAHTILPAATTGSSGGPYQGPFLQTGTGRTGRTQGGAQWNGFITV
jgi:hypothetical protein